MARGKHPIGAVRAVCVALTIVTTGCGLGIVGGESGGDSHLPTRGAGPYGKPDVDFDTPIDEPYVIEFNRADATEPSALWREDGGVRLWFTYQSIEDGAPSEIWHTAMPLITELPDEPPALALAASEAWEEGRVAAPSVIDLGEGHLVMFYEGGVTAPAVGRADSLDRGMRWTKHPDNPLLADAAAPSAGVVGATYFLYSERPSEPGIFVAEAPDGINFTTNDLPVIEPRRNEDMAFDRDAVGSPYLLATEGMGAQPHFGLFYAGSKQVGEDVDVAIGYAAAYDSEGLVRFGDGAVLAAGFPAERGPTVLVTGHSGLMLFSQERRGTQRIAVAFHD